jgi:glycosyltransferase involved in cell wall biosynthesis
MLSFGAMREMKRALDVVKAFEIAKEIVDNLELKVAGSTSGEYAEKVLKYIENSKYKNSIEVLGRVSQEKKTDLMQKSDIICVTSVKEGWGLIVTEANSQGTPACVYDVDGLRDAVKDQVTGLICTEEPRFLAENVVKLIQDKDLYKKLQVSAWQWSKEITFNKCYEDFKKIVF